MTDNDTATAAIGICAHCDQKFGRPVDSVPNRCRHGILCGPCKWQLDEISGFHLPASEEP